MRSRIVHFYFSRFRHIIRQFRHFVFRIGSCETGRSDISLRVAAKTRTKPTGAPSTVYRTNMTLAMASCRSDIFVMSSRTKQTPTLLSWPICTSITFICIITPLKPNARTLRPIPTSPAATVGTGRNETAGSYNFYARTPA